jgi:hypothetical protein
VVISQHGGRWAASRHAIGRLDVCFFQGRLVSFGCEVDRQPSLKSTM